MKLAIIAAIGQNGELGKDNNLIWHLKGDMKFFKDTTFGHTIIMGRKTFESLPRLLPGRKHIVLSNGNIDIPESYWVNHIEIVNSYATDEYTYQVVYVENEVQFIQSLFLKMPDLEKSCGEDGFYGVRPVIYLPLPDSVSKNDAMELVSEYFILGE